MPRSSLREMGVPGVRVLMLEAGAGCRTTRDGGARVRVLTHETGVRHGWGQYTRRKFDELLYHRAVPSSALARRRRRRGPALGWGCAQQSGHKRRFVVPTTTTALCALAGGQKDQQDALASNIAAPPS